MVESATSWSVDAQVDSYLPFQLIFYYLRLNVHFNLSLDDNGVAITLGF